jgi:hypothetical protein
MVPPRMTMAQVFNLLTTQGLPQTAFDGDHLWDNEQHCIKKNRNNTRGWAQPFFCWAFFLLAHTFLIHSINPNIVNG